MPSMSENLCTTINGFMDRQNRQIDGWMDRWTDGLINGSGGNCVLASKPLSIGKRKQIWTNSENDSYSERKF